jgi:hypothetical protein
MYKRNSGGLARWMDGLKLVCTGTGMVLKRGQFAFIAVLVFALFSIVTTMLGAGSTELRLLFSSISLDEKLGVLGALIARTFGVDGMSAEKSMMLVVALLQGVAIALLVYVWRRKKKEKFDVADGVSKTSIGATLALLGAGCSSCGTSLLFPIVSMIFGASGLVASAIIGWVFVIGALALLVFSIKKLGFYAYIITVSERRRDVAKN